MGRHKKIKEQDEQNEQAANESSPEMENQLKKQEAKKESADPLVLIKTIDRDVVKIAVTDLRYEIVHMSGSGSPHNPKIFFIKVQQDKLSEKLTPEQIDNIEAAEMSEIEALINKSRERGMKEYDTSGARRRKLNAEIQPSEFFA